MSTPSHARTAIIGALAALALLGGCDSGPAPSAPQSSPPPAGEPGDQTAPAASAATAAAPLTVAAAFIQEPPAGRDVVLAGVTLTAVGTDLRLTGVDTPIAERVELHTMTSQDGQMRMDQIDGVDLPAGVPVSLKGGGDHLMLFGVGPLDPATTYPMVLTVEDPEGNSYRIEVDASIRPLGE